MNANGKELVKLLESEYPNIAGISAMKNNQVELEYYSPGFSKLTAIHISSVTKSITSMLFGVALKQGHIGSINQHVLDFFPNYKIKRGEKKLQKITIKDMLSMTAPYKFKSEPYTRVYSSEDWTKASLDLLGGKGEIGTFKYTTPALHALSGVLSCATGQNVAEYANKHLFVPLGIQNIKDITLSNRQEHLAFIKSTDSAGWVADSLGNNTPGWGLTMSTLDLAQLGKLYIAKGNWNGQQIISPEWIHESTSQQSCWGERPYGYLWWVIKGLKKRCYAAIGDGGNVLFVCPGDAIIIAITSKFMPRAKDRIALIAMHILPWLNR